MRHLLIVALVACSPGPRHDNGLVDAAPGGGADANSSGDGASGDQVYVYAHTAASLYQVNPDTLAITKIGDFSFGLDQMTDLAIDKTGLMIGVSFTSVYRVDPTNAKTTLLSSNLQGLFNGLSFVPAAQVGATGDDVLIGVRNADGKVFRIDPMTGAATQTGNMGAYQSSGDIVAVANLGTLQTVMGSPHDKLARLAPQTFAATTIGDTGFDHIWGVAYWKNKVYGFTDTGQFILIDPNTGAGMLVSTSSESWWGAAVTTLAPVIQ